MPYIDGKWSWDPDEVRVRGQRLQEKAKADLQRTDDKLKEKGAAYQAPATPAPLSAEEVRMQNASVSEIHKSAFLEELAQAQEENQRLYAEKAKQEAKRQKENEKQAKKEEKKKAGLFSSLFKKKSSVDDMFEKEQER